MSSARPQDWHRSHPQDPGRLLLLVILFFLAAISFEAAGWTEGLWVVRWIAVGGVLVGYLLARVRLPSFVSRVIGVLLGISWTLAWVVRLVRAPSWRLGLEDVLFRVVEWAQLALSGGQGEDNLIFVLFLSLMMWYLAEASAWALFRLDNAWLPAAGAASIVAANAHYGRDVIALHLGLVLLVALALVILTHLRLREQVWRTENVRYDPEVGWQLLRHGMTWALVLAVLTFLSPVPRERLDVAQRLSALEEPWSRLQEEWNRLFAALNYRSSPQATSFGDRLILAGPPRRSQEVVLEVQSARASYWRANVYHAYTGRGWVNTDGQRQSWDPSDPRHRPVLEAKREPLTQVFQVKAVFEQVIFAAPQPVQIQYPVRAIFEPLPQVVGRTLTEGAIEAQASEQPAYPFLDASTFVPRRSLHPGDSYTVVSHISVADKQSLRAARTDYPGWVLERYLQLTDTVTQRTRDLAAEIAAPYDNPYDQAEAIQNYLRQMEYTELVSGPPPGQDGVDYFLFDLRKGFCDYYATAMAVMLRTLDIPARVASGYASGEYDEEASVWRVRDADGHSWVEAYFPDYGWIEFEPTPLRPVPVRPEYPAPPEVNASTGAEPTPDPGLDEAGGLNLPEEAGPLGALDELMDVQRMKGLGLAGLAIGLVSAAVALWWLELRPGHSAGDAYRRFVRWSAFLGLPRRDWTAPAEHARQVAERWPQAGREAAELAELYGAERFGQQEGLGQAAEGSWRRLRGRIAASLLPKVTWGEGAEDGEELR